VLRGCAAAGWASGKVLGCFSHHPRTCIATVLLSSPLCLRMFQACFGRRRPRPKCTAACDAEKLITGESGKELATEATTVLVSWGLLLNTLSDVPLVEKRTTSRRRAAAVPRLNLATLVRV
jgi:hypothetical protein